MDLELYGWENCDGTTVDLPLEHDVVTARAYAQENCLRLIAYQYELSDTELVESYCKPPDEHNDEEEGD